jgi:hypothetical protein
MVRRWSGRHSDREPGAGQSSSHLCPACGRFEHVEKASAVVHRNSGTVVVGNTSYPYVSQLATMLSLPPPPKTMSLESLAKMVLLSWLAGSLIGLVLFLLGDQNWVDVPDGPLNLAMIAEAVVFGLALPVAALSRYLWLSYRARRRLPLWSEARERWSRLYYCSWDDVVFLRDEDDFETPDRVFELLSRHPRESDTITANARMAPARPEAVAAG